MNKTNLLKQCTIFTLTLLFLGLYQTTQAAVGLISFDTTLQTDGTVLLKWETGTEVGTQGFIIKLQEPGSSTLVSLPNIGDAQIIDDDGNTAGFVIAQGSPALGATYEESHTPNGTGTFIYKLFEIDDTDNEVEIDTSLLIIADPNAPTSTFTPTPSPTFTPTPGSIIPPTVPPEPTDTPSTVATDVPSPTNTPVPSNTPTQTNTPIPTVNNTGNNNNATITATSTATSQAINATNTPAVATNTPAPIINTPVAEEEETAVPTTSTLDNGNTVFAQEESTPTVEPIEAETTTDDESYPPPTRSGAELPVENPITTTDTIAPEDDGTTVTVIGADDEEDGDAKTSAELAETSSEATTGRIWLWVGFIIGLLAFVGFAIGAIVIFKRKK